LETRFRRRLVHHAILALAVLTGGLLLSAAARSNRDLRSRVSLVTAYLGLGGIALSLVLGPLNLLRRRPNPVSSDLRRDIGIWGGALGLIHVAVGLTVHLRGKMEQYFLPAPDAPAPLPIRTDAFGMANYLGLLSGLVLVLLLLLSSDLALRRLGSARWKRWQRLNYLAAGAMAAHGVLYQVIEKQRIRFVLLLSLVLAAAVVMQALGIRSRRKGELAAVDRSDLESSPS